MSTTKTRIPLATARQVADKLVAQLAPFCERIEVAGSIRRQKPDVGDIELVAIPKVEQRETAVQMSLFGGGLPMMVDVSLLDEALERMIAEKAITNDGPNHAWGDRMKKFWLRLSGTNVAQVDLFITTPESWGSIFTIRTGPWDFGKALMEHINRCGIYRQMDGALVNRATGQVVPTLEERDYFTAIGVIWLPPERRTVAAIRKMGAGERRSP